MDAKPQPAAATSNVLIGALCGAGASICWAAGFVVAKHGIAVGFSPADLALHRFFWSGLLLIPLVLREGLRDLGGIGWRRGLVMSILAGPPQSMIAYTGFILVPLGHGTTIQPACAALSGLILASLVLHEKPTFQRVIGGATIIAGLLVFGAESLATIGGQGVGGDLLFATAGLFWATFGILLRYWHVSGTRAIAVVGALSILVFAPLHAIFVGYGGILRMGLTENLIQIAVQGRARRHPADLSVRARGHPARRRAYRNISCAGAGVLAGDRLFCARRDSEPRATGRHADCVDRISFRAALRLTQARHISRPFPGTCS